MNHFSVGLKDPIFVRQRTADAAALSGATGAGDGVVGLVPRQCSAHLVGSKPVPAGVAKVEDVEGLLCSGICDHYHNLCSQGRRPSHLSF
jgi:hypothetical protein